MNSESTGFSPIDQEIAGLLRQAVGADALLDKPDQLGHFAQDATQLSRVPELVVQPTTTGQIQELMRLANAYRFPVTPRGLGTGLAGGAVPVHGGVVLSLARMNQILELDVENLLAVVEPGVVNADLKNAARARGLFYPPDPASFDTCSIGGNAATNAGGTSCLKYGTTRDYVLGVEAVLPSGTLLRAGVQTRKGVVGYDLTHLLVGSEGTLGVITKLFLKLLPQPPAITSLIALFADLGAAMRTVTALLGSGHIPCALEFLDHHCLDLVGDLLPFDAGREVGALLLIESDGVGEVIRKDIETMGECCLEGGAIDVLLAPDASKRAQLWDIRRQVSLRIEQNSVLYIPEDVVVPITRIADLVAGLPDFERRYGIRIYAFGHAGDGNIHLNITADSETPRERVDEGIHSILVKVCELGGTISGEHGIGLAKKRYLPLELDSEMVRVQKEIKRVFDPQGILNPGKIFP